MALFLVERSLPGMTVQDLRAAVHALEESCRRLAPAYVRHIETMLIVGGSRCLSLVEAETKEVVMLANSAAQFPFSEIGEVAQVVSQVHVGSGPGSPPVGSTSPPRIGTASDDSN